MSDTMPSDVRANLTALFPKRAPDEQERKLLADGKVGTAAILNRAESVDPALRAMAERLLASGGDDGPRDPVAAVAELRDAILALRMLNARREMNRIAQAMAAEPDATSLGRWRERYAELVGYVARLERSGKVRPRPWAAVLAREEKAR